MLEVGSSSRNGTTKKLLEAWRQARFVEGVRYVGITLLTGQGPMTFKEPQTLFFDIGDRVRNSGCVLRDLSNQILIGKENHNF